MEKWHCVQLGHASDVVDPNLRVSPLPPPMAFMGAWWECLEESFEMRISCGLKASMSWS